MRPWRVHPMSHTPASLVCISCPLPAGCQNMFEVSPQPGTQKELVRTRALYWHSIPLCPKGTYLKKPMTRPLRHCRQINACGLLHPSTNGRSGIAAAQTETESGRKPTPCSGHISFLRPGRGLDCILTWILLCGLGPKRKGTCFLLHQEAIAHPPKKKTQKTQRFICGCSFLQALHLLPLRHHTRGS